MRAIYSSLFMALAVPGVAMAQFSITPGGTNSGNGNFAQGAAATTLAGTGLGGANLRPTTTGSQDQAFQDAWFFRGAGDTRERAFATQSSGGYTGTSALVGNNLNTLDTGGYNHTVTNTNSNAYTFSVQLRWQIVAGPNGPIVNYSAVVTNTAAQGTANLLLSMFHYQDFDVNATTGSDVYAYSAPNFTISEGAINLFHSGIAATAYQAAAFTSDRMGLNNATVTNLNNTVAGSPGDYTGAFQWDLNLAPGASATIGGQFGWIPTPGASALLGLGGLVMARRRRA